MEIDQAQHSRVYTFEEGVPEHFAAGPSDRLTISDRVAQDGKASLKWEFESGSKLTIPGKVGFQPFVPNDEDQSLATFAFWVYLEEPLADKLTVQFGREGNVDCSFDFHLSFTGWRTAWVAYERDMEGTPHPEMDVITIHAPASAAGGTIYIDQIVPSTPIDPRYHTRDAQVPFVNLEADRAAGSHWMGMYHFSQLRPDDLFQQHITEAELNAFGQIEKKVEDDICPSHEAGSRALSHEEWRSIREQFAFYQISVEDGRVGGRPVHLIHLVDMYPPAERASLLELVNPINMKEYTDFLFTIAIAHRSPMEQAKREELERMFIHLLLHMKDQGWAYGSSLGTVHHIGYNLKGLYPAIYLMQDSIKAYSPELFDEMRRMLYWYSGAGRIYTATDQIEGNIDIFNTTIQGMLISLLLLENGPEKSTALHHFSRWLSQSLRPAPGLRAAYKVDGSAYHHVNHYPAYAIGGFDGVTPIVYFLSATPYQIATDAHGTLRKALLAMRLYSNRYQWLVSLSARHPTGLGELSLPPFKYMTLASILGHQQGVDEEMAAAYLRLLPGGEDESTRTLLQAKGIDPEPDPNGHWTMNYAVLGLHRREHWLVGVRGHSRYLWANESYRKNNLYGRYITHGHLQVMSQGEPVNNHDSGYAHDGWNWNRWPGTTTIHLPFEKLRAQIRNVDKWSGYEEMLLSDETFAGSLHLEGRNGMFAMKLHEHPKYEGSHRARKSYFFFDNRVVALGSNIENDNNEYATETTLYQSHLPVEDDPTWMGTEDSSTMLVDVSNEGTLRTESDGAVWLVDNKANGYFIPEGQTVSFSRKVQHSKHQQDGSDTKGLFATAWIEHGKAPKQAAYEYAMLIHTDVETIQEFTRKMADPQTAPYQVLRKDENVHIVKDRATRTIGYAFFEAEHLDHDEFIADVDTPSMVMIREEATGDVIHLSAVDPDLRLYEGLEEDQYDEQGIQQEVSVYSRKWIHAQSKMKRMTISLHGYWQADNEDIRDYSQNQEMQARIRGIWHNNEQTIIEIDAVHAMPVQVTLQKVNEG